MTSPADWCKEGMDASNIERLTGVIASHATKQAFPATEVASVERLTGVQWWQDRSPSVTIGRKTTDYLRVLHRVLVQANSLMFIDPNLDPSSYNYREFRQLLAPLAQRAPGPRIEIHRSFCRGDGPARTFPSEADWRGSFAALGRDLTTQGLAAEVFFWDDFHERYLISDIVGISVGAGFDVTGDPSAWSTWGRLGRDDRDKFQRMFDPAARPPKWHFTIGT